jgi:hypothetical protein
MKHSRIPVYKIKSNRVPLNRKKKQWVPSSSSLSSGEARELRPAAARRRLREARKQLAASSSRCSSMRNCNNQHGNAEIMAGLWGTGEREGGRRRALAAGGAGRVHAYLRSTPEGRAGARPGPARWWSSPDLQRQIVRGGGGNGRGRARRGEGTPTDFTCAAARFAWGGGAR